MVRNTELIRSWTFDPLQIWDKDLYVSQTIFRGVVKQAAKLCVTGLTPAWIDLIASWPAQKIAWFFESTAARDFQVATELFTKHSVKDRVITPDDFDLKVTVEKTCLSTPIVQDVYTGTVLPPSRFFMSDQDLDFVDTGPVLTIPSYQTFRTRGVFSSKKRKKKFHRRSPESDSTDLSVQDSCSPDASDSDSTPDEQSICIPGVDFKSKKDKKRIRRAKKRLMLKYDVKVVGEHVITFLTYHKDHGDYKIKFHLFGHDGVTVVTPKKPKKVKAKPVVVDDDASSECSFKTAGSGTSFRSAKEMFEFQGDSLWDPTNTLPPPGYNASNKTYRPRKGTVSKGFSDTPSGRHAAVGAILSAMGTYRLDRVLELAHASFGYRGWRFVVERLQDCTCKAKKIDLVKYVCVDSSYDEWRLKIEEKDPVFRTFFHDLCTYEDCQSIDEHFSWIKSNNSLPMKLFDIRNAAEQSLKSDQFSWYSHSGSRFRSSNVEPQMFQDGVRTKHTGYIVGSRVNKNYEIETPMSRLALNLYEAFNYVAYSPVVRPVTRLFNFLTWRRPKMFSSKKFSWMEPLMERFRTELSAFLSKCYTLIKTQGWLVTLAVVLCIGGLLKLLGAHWALFLPLIPVAFASVASSFESEFGIDIVSILSSVCGYYVEVMEANSSIRDEACGPRDEDGGPALSACVINAKKKHNNRELIYNGGPSHIFSAIIMSVMMAKTPLAFRVLNFTKFHAGLEAFVEGAGNNVQDFINLVLSFFTKKRLMICGIHDQKVKAWTIEAQEFVNALKTDKLKEDDSDVVNKYFMFITVGENLKMLYQPTTPTFRHIVSVILELTNLAILFPAFTSPGKVRPEPIGVMFQGEAGVGKSTLLALFASEIARAVSGVAPEDYDEMSMVYQKGESDFWDGYGNQIVCTFDDFLQKNLVPGGTQDEATMAIKAINQWPFPLNMAALQQKGRFYFRSSFVLGTTNLKLAEPLTKVICSLDALQRRFPFQYEITKKFSGDIPPDSDPNDVWVFTPIDIFRTKEDKGKGLNTTPITYDEMVEIVLREHYRRKKWFNARMSGNKEYIIKRTAIHTRIRKEYEPVKVDDDEVPALTENFDEFDDAEEPDDFKNVPKEIKPVVPNGGVMSIGAATMAYAGAAATLVSFNVARSAVNGFIAGCIDVIPQSIIANWDRIIFAIKAIGALVLGVALAYPLVSAMFKSHGGIRYESNVKNDDVLKRIQGNVMPVLMDSSKIGFGLALDDGHFLVPSHYVIAAIEKKKNLFFVCDGVQIPLVNIKSVQRSFDMIVFNVKTRRPSIVKHIGSCDPHTECYFVREDSISDTTTVGKTKLNYMNDDITTHYLFSHSLRTFVGDCGSVLVVKDNKKKFRLVGFHVAGIKGVGGHGFCAPLSCLPEIEHQFHGHEDVGVIDKPIHNGRASCLIATAYAGLFGPVTTLPAAKRPVLVDGVVVDPHIKAIKASVQNHPELPKHTETVCHVVVNELFKLFDKDAIKTFSWEEAAEGIAGEPYLNSLNRSGSPGYPFITMGHHNKKSIFGAEGPFDFSLDAAKKAIEAAKEVEFKYKRGERCCVFRDSLKDETRSIAKVLAGDTRIISGSALEYTLVVRKYFMGFASEFMKTRLHHGGLVGINPYSRESEWIFDRMTGHNKDGLCFAGDFKQFDKRQHPLIMKYMWEAICANMPNCTLDNKILFDTIGLETYNATHLGGNAYESNQLYRVWGSLPSGHPLTSILNSIYNMIVFRMAWVEKKGLSAVGNFRDEVLLYVYGDDNWCAPSQKCLDFNFSYMKSFCPKINMEYTNEEKTGTDYTLKPASECGFLKRKYVRDDDGWTYARLELDSIKEMFNWQKKSTNEREHAEAVSKAALMESSAYEIDVFYWYFQKIEALCQRLRISSPSLGLGVEMAYAYWRDVYKGHVPIWSPDSVVCIPTVNTQLVEGQANIVNNENTNTMENMQKLSEIQNSTHPETTTADSTDIAFDANPASHGVTTLIAAAPVVEPIDSSRTRLYNPDIHRDILKYIERPKVAQSGSFANGAVLPLFQATLTPAYYRTFLSNLTGAYAFRATACYRLEIVAAPQTSGIVKFAFCPLTNNLSYAGTRPRLAQLENVEINVAEASAAEIRIPFLYDKDFMTYQPIADELPVGVVTMMPYLPVQWDTTTTTSPTYTIFVWFEDVEPIGRSTALITAVPQMGEVEFTGPVSKWFGMAATIASKLAYIPEITFIARPVSWIAGTAAAVAAHFGWSKPVNGSYSGIVGPTMGRAINTCADQDFAHPLAYYANNEVKVINFANNKHDEMSFCYLTCKPGMIAQFTWSPTDVALKWTCPVTPLAFTFQSGTGFAQQCKSFYHAPASGNQVGFIPSTIAFLASNFRYWRGDLVFRFKFARTKFHTGRLLIGYVPSVNAFDFTNPGRLDRAPDPANRYDFDSIVVDLRSTSEVDLVVPYTYPTLFCNTNAGNTISDTAATLFASTGVVFVRVLDRLYGPDNVAQNVPIAVEVFAKCGLEFSYPITSSFAIIPEGSAVEAQMGGDDDNHLDAVMECSGERILSVKQLCMRPSWNYLPTVSGQRGYWANLDLQHATLSGFLPNGAFNSPVNDISVISYFSSMYGLIRGSLIGRIVPALTSTGTKSEYMATALMGDSQCTDWRHLPFAVEGSIANCIKVPFYETHNRVRTGWVGGESTQHKTVYLNLGGLDSSYNIGVCAGDDFQMGAFKGVPPCCAVPTGFFPDPYFHNTATAPL